MRNLVLMLLTSLCVVTAEPAGAKGVDSCELLTSLVNLPDAIRAVGKGAAPAGTLELRIRRLSKALENQVRVAVFTEDERRRLSGILMALAQMQATDGQGRQAALDAIEGDRALLSGLAKRFGCHGFNTDGDALVKALPADQGSMIVRASLLAFLAAAVVAAVFAGRIFNQRWKGSRQVCRTPALLHYTPNCTVTHILDVSRFGAKLETPEEALPLGPLELLVCDQRIPAHLAWQTRYFLGLKFVHPISARLKDEIVAASRDGEDAMNPGKQAPSCFHPGCHLTCERHRFTGLSLVREGPRKGRPVGEKADGG